MAEEEKKEVRKRRTATEAAASIGPMVKAAIGGTIQAKKEGKDLLLCIDVKGGMYLKKNFKWANVITIFVCAPDEGELKQRLKKRVEEAQFIKKRLQLAKKELHFARDYDYLLVNRDISEAAQNLKIILYAEQFRR